MALRRIDAQLSEKSYLRDKEDPSELFAKVEAQYSGNIAAWQGTLAQEKAVLDKSRQDLASAEQIRVKLEAVLPHYRAQEAAYAKLEKDGFAGKLMYTDKQRVGHEAGRDR